MIARPPLFSLMALLGSSLLACQVSEESTPRVGVDAETDAALAIDGVVQVTAVDYSFAVSSEIPSGWTTFQFTNAGQEHHFFLLQLLPEGKTFADYQREVATPFEEVWRALEMGADKAEAGAMLVSMLPDWYGTVRPMGGPGLLGPGRSVTTVARLEPGSYVMECYVKSPDGTFHSTLGMQQPFTVTSVVSDKGPPEADIEIALSNYEIDVSGEVTSGQHTVAVRFEEHPVIGLGNDVHLVRLESGTTVESIIPWMDWMNLDGLRAPAPATFIGGSEEMPVGHTAYFQVSLEPGRYAWIAESTAALGMVREFTVN